LLSLIAVLVISACGHQVAAPSFTDHGRSGPARWQSTCVDSTAINKFCFPAYTISYSDVHGYIKSARVSVTDENISLLGAIYPGRHGDVQIDDNQMIDMPWNYNAGSARVAVTPEIYQQIMAGQTMIVRFTEWPVGIGHEIPIPLITLKPLLQSIERPTYAAPSSSSGSRLDRTGNVPSIIR
jgi:hypothetical protein